MTASERPLFPPISSVTLLVIALARNCRSASLALLITLTFTGIVGLRAEIRLRNLSELIGAGVHAAGDVIQAAVDKVQAREAGGAGDARDALHVRVDLQLVGLQFLRATGRRCWRTQRPGP